MEWLISKEKDIEVIAYQLLKSFSSHKVFTFSGNLGSGKTTFIKYLCKVLGVKEQVSSPTFSLINEYRGDNNVKIYHFDIYRIKNKQEAYAMGYEEYFYSGNYCFIEWPEMIEEMIPDDAVAIEIKSGGRAEEREISIKQHISV